MPIVFHLFKFKVAKEKKIYFNLTQLKSKLQKVKGPKKINLFFKLFFIPFRDYFTGICLFQFLIVADLKG